MGEVGEFLRPWTDRVRAHAIGEKIGFLGEAGALQQTRCPWPRLRHEHRRRRVEALDLQAYLLVDREVERAHHLRHAFCAQPIRRGGEQRVGRFLIVEAIEKAEMAGAVLMAFEMMTIDLRADASHRRAVAGRDKQPRLAELEKRPFFRVDPVLVHDEQRGHPRGVVAVDYIGHPQKEVAGPRVGDRRDRERTRRHQLFTSARVTASVTLRPPNAKEFDNAASIWILRGPSGITSMGQSGSRSL